MKRTETPNNNPWLAAAVSFSIMLLAALLFVFTANYRQYGDGDTDGGKAYFGSGSGNGDGSGNGKTGDNGDGDSDTGSAEVDGKEDNGGKAEEGEPDGDKEIKVSGSGTWDSGETSSGSSSKAAEKSGTSGRINYRDMGVAEIFTGKEPVKKTDNDKENSDNDNNGNSKNPARRTGVSGRRAFSSGGKSVFRIKKHENVLFIIDVSGSMMAPTLEQQSRLQVLQHQLKKTIYSMNKVESVGKFSILAFSDTINYFPEKGSRKSFIHKKYCDSAVEWIDSLRAGGGTSLGLAIEETVTLIKKKKINVDCIYLLTDGEPTDIYDDRKFLSSLKKRIPASIKFFTISIGRKSALLQDIAKLFNGNYNQYD